MTTITREHLEQALANPTKITFNYGETLELARIALASLDAKPVAWTDEQELRDVENSGSGYLFTVNPITQYADPFRVIKLFTVPPAPVVPETLPCDVELKPGMRIGKGCKTETLLTALKRRADYCSEIDAMTPEERVEHDASIEAFKAMLPTPAPTVTFFRDGIEAAAAWVDKQREEYDNEHGRLDPDTGSFEFGNDAQRDYSATLEEIAEGIRALHPNTAPPAPVSVPDEITFEKIAEITASQGYEYSINECICAASWWNACRAAMLQGGK